GAAERTSRKRLHFMFTRSEHRRRCSESPGRGCVLALTRHPERKSRDPEEVFLKVLRRAPSTPLGMTGGEFALRARAFTLLEIMLAVIILGMMSLASYRFVQANFTALRISSADDSADMRYVVFRELLTS